MTEELPHTVINMNNNQTSTDETEDSDSLYDSDESGEKFLQNESTRRDSKHSDHCVNSDDGLDVTSVKSAVSGDGIIERIEDRRFSLPVDIPCEYTLRQRTACSENDVALKSTLNESLHSIKSQIEDKLQKNLCKECLYRSIQSKLSMLGIVSASNRNVDVFETDANDNSDDDNALLKDHDEIKSSAPSNVGRSLIKSLHRRTLSEIDWHELTRFAQGDIFDPQSSTAKEIKRVVEEGKDELVGTFKMMQNIDLDYVVEEAERCVQCIINSGWRVVSHWELPQWLRDNDYLWHMHRPQLPSFKECFCSMFRIHTETGNIWTHFLGLIIVVMAMMVIYLSPSTSIGDFPKGWEEYLAFTAFFIGAISCLAFSWLYHTVSCHSKKASKLFSKLDYTGIACMIMGSFVPCMYYGFYCQFYEKLVYSLCIVVLGLSCIVVSLWDKFATPGFRVVRAGVFLALGCSGIFPVIHIMVMHGVQKGSQQMSLGWLILMGFCYILGAVLYAMRIPERFFPGRCNLLFQSHQIFHVLVVMAALIHLHGCCQMALYRIKVGRDCPAV